MAYADTLPKQRSFGETTRPYVWWLQPLVVFLGFSAFIVYSTWAAFHPLHEGAPAYWYHGNGANYLSPFFSPEIFGYTPDALFGPKPAWWPAWLMFSPAFFVLWAPGGFRFTCYYYRGAYYKAFWADPINCAVGEPRKSYLGERFFPLIIQNIHRYFFYLAALFILLLAHDAWKSMWFSDGPESTHYNHFGIGLGTIVLTLNPIFLGLYTFGCHSFRHLIGGFLDSKSKAPTCAKAYNCVSTLNGRHMMWAWISLFWVGSSDVYVRLCATGHFTDKVLFHL